MGRPCRLLSVHRRCIGDANCCNHDMAKECGKTGVSYIWCNTESFLHLLVLCHATKLNRRDKAIASDCRGGP